MPLPSWLRRYQARHRLQAVPVKRKAKRNLLRLQHLEDRTVPAPTSPNLNLNPSTINENSTVSLSGNFTDPGSLDKHTVTIDWSDGSANTVLSRTAGLFTIPATSHKYLDDNPSGTTQDSYTITVTVADEDGGTASNSKAVTVRNVAPSGLSLTLSD